MQKKRYAIMLALALALPAIPALGADRPTAAATVAPAPFKDQQALIKILTSDAPKAEKAITCKYLAIVGRKEAVPALAPLLEDQELASWARIALESIPGPEADDALRYAIDKVQGRLLIGVINSLGYRRAANAVDNIIPKLKDADPEVASSAAAALGKIGGGRAAAALEQFLSAAPVAVRPAVAEGCILAAEQFAAAGSAERAAKLFEQVCAADVPQQRKLEAIRGAILAKQSVPMLAEQLRSEDKETFTMGLRIARDLKAAGVTEAVVAELGKTTPPRQALLIVMLADRGDAAALPAVLEMAKTGKAEARIAAVRVMDKLGNVSCVPALLDAAAADDAALSQAAMTSLVRLAGKEVDADLFGRLKQSSGKQRQVLIELAEQRRLEGGLAFFAECAADPDAGVRTAALVALGAVGEDKQVPALVGLLQKPPYPADRESIEKALTSVCSRWNKVMPDLKPLASSPDAANRIVALRAAAACGGPEALAAVKSALADKEEAVADEAVRTLSTWANRWPDDASVTEPLLELAKDAKKPAHRVLAIRGYLQYVQGAKTLSNEDRMAKVNQVLALITRPEEKRLAISALGANNAPTALAPLMTLAADPAVTEEACQAILTIVTKNARGVAKPQRQAALNAVIAQTKSAETKKKAEDLLKAAK